MQVLGPGAEFETEFVANNHAAQLRGMTSAEGESCDIRTRQTLLPADGNRLLRQALLHVHVVIGLHFNQGRQHVLVVVTVLVVEQCGGKLRFINGIGAFQVNEASVGFGFPQLFQFVYLVLRDVACADLELIRWYLKGVRER